MRTEPEYKIYTDGKYCYYVRSGLGSVGYAIFKCKENEVPTGNNGHKWNSPKNKFIKDKRTTQLVLDGIAQKRKWEEYGTK